MPNAGQQTATIRTCYRYAYTGYCLGLPGVLPVTKARSLPGGNPCDSDHYFPHSCGNRHCPHCQHHESQQWLENQCRKQVPANHLLITFTVPAQLRKLFFRHQRRPTNGSDRGSLRSHNLTLFVSCQFWGEVAAAFGAQLYDLILPQFCAMPYKCDQDHGHIS